MTNSDARFAMRRAVAELIVHLSQAIYAMGFAGRLRPAQWAALRYLQRTNASARTVTAFAQANLITKGAASQMIKGLETEGLVKATPSAADQRSKRLDITREGRQVLRDDPLNLIVAALDVVDDVKLLAAVQVIEALLKQPFEVKLNNPAARKRMARLPQSPRTARTG